jgi:hypothetical protein
MGGLWSSLIDIYHSSHTVSLPWPNPIHSNGVIDLLIYEAAQKTAQAFPTWE